MPSQPGADLFGFAGACRVDAGVPDAGATCILGGVDAGADGG
ncbi:MAG TPA: hypothetical protein VH044_14050 [Polyangiaceae bacterium]|jgi:hypothetical protein|nr:hypothetical protein [Polyangiaceae bacterium]